MLSTINKLRNSKYRKEEIRASHMLSIINKYNRSEE